MDLSFIATTYVEIFHKTNWKAIGELPFQSPDGDDYDNDTIHTNTIPNTEKCKNTKGNTFISLDATLVEC